MSKTVSQLYEVQDDGNSNDEREKGHRNHQSRYKTLLRADTFDKKLKQNLFRSFKNI